MRRLRVVVPPAVLILSAALCIGAAPQSSAALFGYLADYNNGKVMALDSDGTVTPLANVPAASGAALDSAGNLYVGSGTAIQKITPAGVATPFASASVTFNGQLTFASGGVLLAVSEANDQLEQISQTGTATPIFSGFSPPPEGVAVNATGIYLSLYDGSGGSGSKVVRINAGGLPSTFASGLNTANGIAFDTGGNLYVASEYGNSIYKITPSGVVSTFASSPLLNGPYSLAFDAAGNLFSANYFDGSVSEISPAGVVSPFASSGLGQGLSGIALLPTALVTPPGLSAYEWLSQAGPNNVIDSNAASCDPTEGCFDRTGRRCSLNPGVTCDLQIVPKGRCTYAPSTSCLFPNGAGHCAGDGHVGCLTDAYLSDPNQTATGPSSQCSGTGNSTCDMDLDPFGNPFQAACACTDPDSVCSAAGICSDGDPDRDLGGYGLALG
ncbi:MAG TPA: hypothetical protein VMR31_17205, partial [Myxococcota bacterium]|nr:hypothetical protein [Myxococcota bacterium]